ncbi:uncharacterized protein LOC136041944 isoform X2 [Artemia franciscana]|uniref:uncharacterized protein LOC136041944 isoform X2 n=1 Tax=Artemia franciscana TaxID=6661 RepID=UPI0032D9AFAC
MGLFRDNNHNMNVSFKERKTFAARKEEAENIRAKFPTKVPAKSPVLFAVLAAPISIGSLRLKRQIKSIRIGIFSRKFTSGEQKAVFTQPTLPEKLEWRQGLSYKSDSPA